MVDKLLSQLLDVKNEVTTEDIPIVGIFLPYEFLHDG